MVRKYPSAKRLMALALLIGMISLASPFPAAAQETSGATISVIVFTDDNVRNGNCTLREAIQAANVNRAVDRCPAGSASSADTIQLAAGTYVISVDGIRENANFKGDFDVLQSVNILGAGKDSTIIDAKGLDRVFNNRSSTSTLRIKDMTIQNGATGQDDRPDNGGAISGQGTMLITRVRFRNNSVSSITEEKGGAIYNAGRLELTDSDFESNLSQVEGGAIANAKSAKLWRVNFTNNLARGGAAVFNSGSGATVEIYESKFTGNQCGTGHGSAIVQKAGSSMLVENSVFDQNGECDGAVVVNEGTLTIRKSTFTANNSYSDRSVIRNAAGTLTLSESTFTGNGSDSPVMSVDAPGGKVTIERTTMSGNLGADLRVSGGWVRVGNSTFTGAAPAAPVCLADICVQSGTLFLESVTVADSRSETGAALLVQGGTATLHNTILANSTRAADGTAVADCQGAAGAIVTRGYNLISRADGCNLTPATGDQFGTLAAPIDPLLDGIKDNGGPTFTRALLPGSPAIDKADGTLIFRVDQRLYNRLAGPRSDVGAFEANSTPAQP